jgi:hypothetical protein
VAVWFYVLWHQEPLTSSYDDGIRLGQPRSFLAWLTTDRERFLNEMWLGLTVRWGEPRSMCWRVRAQCPLPADSVDAYRVHRQDTVGPDVETEKCLRSWWCRGAYPSFP